MCRGNRIGEEELLDMAEGTVRWYNPKKGFGFIEDESGPDVFVHFSQLVVGSNQLRKGDQVEYEIVQGEKGPKAAKVTKKPADPATAARN